VIKTRVTELFNIEYPIIGGCMMHISTPAFVASISNAGALGMMASAMYDTEDQFREAVHKTRSLTDKPFGVNLTLFPALKALDNELYVEVILDEGVPIVETSGHRPPEDLLDRLRAAGLKLMHKCLSPRHALSAQRAGVDAVTIFGSEGGGHIGELGLTTMTLVPQTAASLEIPVIAAGGIADGRGLLAALALGAEGVTIGSILLVTDECPIHENLKQALISASELDTVPILGSVHNSLRAWKNAAVEEVLELEQRGAGLEEILKVVAGTRSKEMYAEGDINLGVMACSQSIGIVGEIRPVADVIQSMVEEAAARHASIIQ